MVGHNLEPADAAPARVRQQRRVAVKRQRSRYRVRIARQGDSVYYFFGVHRAEIRVVQRLLDSVRPYRLAGQHQELPAELHPCDRHAGLLHDSRIRGVALTRRRVVEQLVRAARAADYRDVGREQAASEVDDRLSPTLLTGRAVVFEQSLEAGHHLVCLRHRILIRVGLVLERQLEDVRDRCSALVYYVRREIQILRRTGQVVQPHHRLEQRRRVQSAPVACSLGNRRLALARRSEL